ncbi:MAG TPA: hypothetical protein PKA49_01495, partial [Tepidiformaceae bacterium]|nr:hypothetical protein [Tepidiformaceae bacterium]
SRSARTCAAVVGLGREKRVALGAAPRTPAAPSPAAPTATATASPTNPPPAEPSASPTATRTPTPSPSPAPAGTSKLTRTTPTPDSTGRRATLAEAKPGLKIESLPAEDGQLRWLISPRTAGRYEVTWSLSQYCGDGGELCPVGSLSTPLCEAGEGATCPESSDRSSFEFEGAGPGSGVIVTLRLADADPEVCTVKASFSWNSEGRRGSERATYTCSGASAMGWPLLAVAFLCAVSFATLLVRRRNLWPR